MIHKMGYRFPLHRNDLSGTPNLVFPKYKSVIFVHGCFWHGYEDCKKASIPDTNTNFGKDKIDNNKKRDLRNYEKLEEEGWNYLLIWQCEIKKIKSNIYKRKLKSF